jgi:hypothetical protein
VPRKTITFDTVRELGLALPDVEADTYFGTPALKVRGKMFACITSHKSAEPNTLAVVLGFDRREELIAEQPDIYYLKEHYVGYPCVLVRLGRVHKDALSDLLLMGWRFVSARAKKRAKPRRPTSSRARGAPGRRTSS